MDVPELEGRLLALEALWILIEELKLRGQIESFELQQEVVADARQSDQ